MFFRFLFNRFFVAAAAFTILAAGIPAYGANQKPEVEVDLSVLQDLPVRPQSTPANPAPVERTPLQPGSISHAEPARSPINKPALPAKSARKAGAVHKAAVIKKKKKPPARHRHPVAPPVRQPKAAAAKVTARALSTVDASAQNPAAPNNKKPAANLGAVSAAQTAPPNPAPPQPVTIKTITSEPPLPAPTGTAPEKSRQAPPAYSSMQPPAEKQNVPRPPPADARETSHFSLPFKAGSADQLDSQIIFTLQSQILPLLKNHPGWRLRINAFASPVDSEPISARRISLARALTVRSWLLDKGVAARRMDVRAAGLETGREPPDRVDMVFLDPDGG
jgi:outer membrane protein OmpA-like peptidoglycan-associated protein